MSTKKSNRSKKSSQDFFDIREFQNWPPKKIAREFNKLINRLASDYDQRFNFANGLQLGFMMVHSFFCYEVDDPAAALAKIDKVREVLGAIAHCRLNELRRSKGMKEAVTVYSHEDEHGNRVSEPADYSIGDSVNVPAERKGEIRTTVVSIA